MSTKTYQLVGGFGLLNHRILDFCEEWQNRHSGDRIISPIRRKPDGEFVLIVESESDPLQRASEIWRDIYLSVEFTFRHEQAVELATIC